MKNRVFIKYFTNVSIYTVAFILVLTVFVFIMDNIFNGSLLDFLYKLLPLNLFYLINYNRELTFFIIYILGLAALTIAYIVRFNKILNIAGALVTNDDNQDLYIQMPDELENLAQKIKDFKYELKETERAKQFAEQQKNDLIVYLAHDLKTPLTSVIGYLSMLEEAQDLPIEQRAKYIGIALDKAYRLEQLINEFFDITRLNLHTIETYKSKVNVTVLLLQCIDEFFPMLEEKNINFIQDIKPSLFVNADADKLARVFENLFRNAVNYSYESTDLICNAYSSKGKTIISIKNTGDDIPNEKLERLFDKFYRIDSSRRTSTGGSGLGLAISKQIIELHNGTITASCNNGITEFKVILPN